MSVLSKTGTHFVCLCFFFSFTLFLELVSESPLTPSNTISQLEQQVCKDLLKINYPRRPWIFHTQDSESVLDVAIIGGGQSGLTVCFALLKEGIDRVKIFDENGPSQEGPWIKYARMRALRSDKKYMGPAMGVPSLTFWSWFEALYGEKAWSNLKFCPTNLWQEYLGWFRCMLNLPVENEMKLVSITPFDDRLKLDFRRNGNLVTTYARKVVLATGREGSGGPKIPDYISKLPKKFFLHTSEVIDTNQFKDRRIAIVGAGSSAFDAAAEALENGALSVDMLVRRSRVSQINKFSQFSYSGLENGFFSLPDELRCLFFAEALKCGGVDPSKAAIERIKDLANFYIHYNIAVNDVKQVGESVEISSLKRKFTVDLIILATGYDVDLSQRAELESIYPFISLWKDRVPHELLEVLPILGRFPYLGPHFEFIEHQPGSAPYLKNIHCFNYGSALSHSLISCDIPGISMGATRLAKGIAVDFFVMDSLKYIERIKNWNKADFNPDHYPNLKEK